MAGRGKGKPTLSINTEKSEKVELPPVKPPPDYPDVNLAWTHFEMTNELEYLVELKRGFVESMRNSEYYLQLEEEKKDIERYSDCYRETIKEKSVRDIVDCDWSMFPAELAPSSERKKTALKTKSDKKEMIKAKRKKPRPIDDDDDDDDDGGNKQNTEVKLQQQKSQQAQNNTDKEMKNIKEEEEDSEDSENMEEYEEVDQEMDYGTDYLNNYFDNGEDLDDDDDNPDDGPVY